MSFVAAAIVGGAVVGGIATTVGANAASGAVREGSRNAADATIQSTQMQIDEIGRQFDFQMELLNPFIQNQYAGQSAYMDLLGIGGGAGARPQYSSGGGGGGPASGPRGGGQDYYNMFQQPGGSVRPGGGSSRFGGGSFRREDGGGQYGNALQPSGGPQVPAYPGSGSTTFNYGDRGQFIDPNLDQTRLADTTRLGDAVRDNLLAREGGAASTSIYGTEFESSPGYEYQVEEMGRELDRRNSAGGNYGGRAIMEAQRRAQGLAQGDYYNWAQGASRDLDRRTGAESRDAERLDSAAAQEDRLAAGDQARGDQAYYNYLQMIGAVGGVGGNPTGQAVNSSMAAGGAVAGAYGSQGRQLSDNYGRLGTDEANIAGSQWGSYNDIIQGTIRSGIEGGIFG